MRCRASHPVPCAPITARPRALVERAGPAGRAGRRLRPGPERQPSPQDEMVYTPATVRWSHPSVEPVECNASSATISETSGYLMADLSFPAATFTRVLLWVCVVMLMHGCTCEFDHTSMTPISGPIVLGQTEIRLGLDSASHGDGAHTGAPWSPNLQATGGALGSSVVVHRVRLEHLGRFWELMSGEPRLCTFHQAAGSLTLARCDIGDGFSNHVGPGETVRLRVWVSLGAEEDVVLEAEFECARDQGSTLVNPFLDFT